MLLKILVALTLLMAASNSYSEAKIPTKDIAGSKDHPLLNRIDGAYIVAYRQNDYDEFKVPLSQLLKAEDDERDKRNNRVYKPKKEKTLEGGYTRIVYLLPENVSPLGAFRGYKNEIKNNEGDVLFECKEDECGGGSNRASDIGGDDMSISEYLFPGEKVTEGDYTNGGCAIRGKISGQRYAVYNISKENIYISLLTYSLGNNTYCNAFKNYTILIFDIIEEKYNDIKTVDSKDTNSGDILLKDGKIIIHDIDFQREKITVKAEFKDEFKKITDLMDSDKTIELLVVSHTDNQDTLSMNMSVSQKRADALVKEIIGNHGISADRLVAIGVGSSSPITSNATKEGRALNERIEMVVR